MAPTLTKDQEEACDKFMRFLLSNEKEFYLFGSAGSGKTFLAKQLKQIVETKYPEYCRLVGLEPRLYGALFTASTNKAAAVLSETIRDSVSTIYNLFGIKVTEDFKTGDTNLEVTGSPNVQNFVIFIDECSMLSRRALQIIRKLCPDTSKLVFIGDNNQLAPVNEKPYWNNTPERTTAYLSTPVRNKESKNLVELCNQLKGTVQTGKFYSIIPDAKSIIRANDEIAENFLKNFNPDTDIVLAYTNEKVEKYSQYISKYCKNLHPEKDVMVNVDHYVSGYKWGEANQTGKSYYPEQRFRDVHIKKGTAETSLGYTDFKYKGAWAIDVITGTKEFVYLLDPEVKQKLLKTFSWRKAWKDYYMIKNGFMVLRTTYATTVHKSQGSTYDRVFIDLDSFNACRDKETLTRLLYVAVSRARKQVVFYGSVDLEKFHHAF